MRYGLKKNKIVAKKGVAFILLFALFLSPIPTFFSENQPSKAIAQVVPVLDSVNLTQNTTTAGATTATAAATATTATATTWLTAAKEGALDGIAWALTQAILSRMVSSITDWVNSGFQGSPAFIENPGRFLLGIADEIGGAFIESIAPWLCEPFRLDIQMQLSLHLETSRTTSIPRCTVTDVIENIEGFLAGDFIQGGRGGWNAWFSLTQNQQNNPHGSYLQTSSEMAVRIEGAQSITLIELDWGQGFLSWKDGDGNIQTPGTVINNQLNQALPSGMRSLELADEFNELVGALLGQFMNQVFSSGGLSGASRGGRTIGQRSATQRLLDESNIQESRADGIEALDTTNIYEFTEEDGTVISSSQFVSVDGFPEKQWLEASGVNNLIVDGNSGPIIVNYSVDGEEGTTDISDRNFTGHANFSPDPEQEVQVWVWSEGTGWFFIPRNLRLYIDQDSRLGNIEFTGEDRASNWIETPDGAVDDDEDIGGLWIFIEQ